jgi:hypothetical protein
MSPPYANWQAVRLSAIPASLQRIEGAFASLKILAFCPLPHVRTQTSTTSRRLRAKCAFTTFAQPFLSARPLLSKRQTTPATRRLILPRNFNA